MVEANPVKFYLAKYFLLVIAMMQWIIGAILLYLDDFTVFNLAVDGTFILIGILLVILFVKVSERIKRVAIGKNKFVILEGHYNIRFEWPEVKSIRIVPILNLCKVRFRGKKGNLYFFSTKNVRSALEKLSILSEARNRRELDMKNPSLS
jgi:hypothetical protein